MEKSIRNKFAQVALETTNVLKATEKSQGELRDTLAKIKETKQKLATFNHTEEVTNRLFQ